MQIPLFKVAMDDKVDGELLKVLHSGWIGQGSKVNEFEEKISKKFNNKNVVSLSSGTHGIDLALRISGVTHKDSVICSSLSCNATCMPIVNIGAEIIWADTGYDINATVNSIEDSIKENTKAIVIVHWGGYPVNLKEIYKIANERGIKVIEDAAHCYGSTYKDSIIGDCRYSDFCMISTQAIKFLTSVTPETPVMIKRNNIIELVEIGKLDKNIIGNECISFTMDGKTKWSKIYDFIKHPIKERILKIKLEKGRQVNITKSHSIYTYKNGEFYEILGRDLKIGDYIAAPRKINVTENIIDKIDLLELLKHKILMVNDDKIRLNYEGRGGNAGKWIDRYIKVDEDFCKILGYYVAEGSIIKHYRNGKITDNSPLAVIFSMGIHEEFTNIQDLIYCLERKFPTYKAQKYIVNPNKTGIRIHFGSTLFAEIIKAMNPGMNTYKKRIPDIIWNVSDSCKRAFLDGYFNGDCHKRCQDGHTDYINWSSASKELTNGIHYLLLSMGKQTSSLELNEGYELNKKGEEMNRYGGYVINYEGQQYTSKENCIPSEFVNENTTKKSFSINRILYDNLECKSNLLNDICLLKIKEIEEFDYDGYVYDFSVEGVENFIGGYGAICLHNTCDGGLLFTKNKKDYERAKLLRWFGISRENNLKDMRCINDISEAGFKYHMNDVCATVGLCNMELAEKNVEISRRNAKIYDEEFSNIDGIKLTQTAIDRSSSYWLYTILVKDRTSFVHMMGSKGIAVSRVHERLDEYTYTKKFKKELPILEEIYSQYICIPVGWWLKPEDREYIISCVKGGW
jgi:dTDP-4-amino-4,6-dideoxygalactose transaminase/intein/homing endonuclease